MNGHTRTGSTRSESTTASSEPYILDTSVGAYYVIADDASHGPFATLGQARDFLDFRAAERRQAYKERERIRLAGRTAEKAAYRARKRAEREAEREAEQ